MSLLEMIAERSKIDPAQFSLPDLLAEQALAHVRMRPGHRFNRMIAECLAAEVLRESPTKAIHYAQQLLDHGVSEDLLLDGYIAGAADHLGRAWETDRLSFAQVTHGMGQLLEVAHHVMAAPPVSSFMKPDRPRALLARAPKEEHILGLLLTAQKMRHAGWLVRVELSGDITKLAESSDGQGFDLVGLTASCGERLRGLKRAIAASRRSLPKAKVILGGHMVTAHRDTAELAGADLLLPRGSNALKSIANTFNIGDV